MKKLRKEIRYEKKLRCKKYLKIGCYKKSRISKCFKAEHVFNSNAILAVLLKWRRQQQQQKSAP